MKKAKTNIPRILLVGIGNSSREDDGLGWKFTDMVLDSPGNKVSCEYRFQLQVEDADLINAFDIVIFADASRKKIESGFELRPCEPADHFFYSSHMQSPETILFLSNLLYKKHPHTFTLAIAGEKWGLKTGLSKSAKRNLQAAYTFFTEECLPSLHIWQTDGHVQETAAKEQLA